MIYSTAIITRMLQWVEVYHPHLPPSGRVMMEASPPGYGPAATRPVAGSWRPELQDLRQCQPGVERNPAVI